MKAWRLLLTRPAEESEALAQTLAEVGVYSASLPLLEIESLPVSEANRSIIYDLAAYCAVIVVSKPAARLGLAMLDEVWPQPPMQKWFTVGAATAQILDDYGLPVFFPEHGDDSEALLDLPQFQQAVSGYDPKVLIMRGEDGRELLAERLRERGVVVDYLPLYRRHLPQYPAFALPDAVKAERLNGLVVSSGQGFEHLRELAGDAWPTLAQMPLFVPSPRVAEMARAAGAFNVVDCRGASAPALLAALREHPAPAHRRNGRSVGLRDAQNAKDGYVSDTVLPKDDVEPVLVKPEPLPDPAYKEPSTRRSSNGLAILALLLGAAGVAVGGWSVWQLRAMQAGHQEQSGQLQDIGSQTQALKQSEQQIAARLAQLPPAQELEDRRRLVTQLQGDQQRLSQRVETVLGASRKDWRLAEAEHLLRLASLRLSALQDINSAAALVQGADEILREQDDPGAFAAREQLARSLTALRSVDQPDRTGLFLQLAAVRDQVAQMNELAPEYKDKGDSLFGLTDGTEDSYWAKWWEKISQYVRIDFHADKNIRPLLAGQSLTQVRLALSLAIEQAQWAALNGQAPVYEKAMAEARSVLDDNFNRDNQQSKALGQRLDELGKQPVSVATPDLTQSLAAVQAYLEQRHTPVGGALEKRTDEAQPGKQP